MMQELGTLLHLLKNKWYDRVGLAAAETLGILVLTAMLPNLGLEYVLPRKLWFVAYVLLSAIILCSWLFSRNYLPKNRKSKIGMTIAIYAETERDEIRIKSDFVRALESAISSQFPERIFRILILNNYRSQRARTKDDAVQISNRTRSHFVIWGNFRRRQHHGRSIYALNLYCLVRHRPIPLDRSNKLSREFTKLFPPKNVFPETEELEGFEITTDMFREATIYMVGVAALISGNISLSLKLHERLYSTVRGERQPERIAHLRLLKSRLRDVLAEEYTLAARFHYESKEYRDLGKVEDYAQAARDMDPRTCLPHLLLAICYFYKKSVPLALREVLRAKKIAPRDGGVLYSEAFIYYYSRRYEKAETAYRKAIRTQTPSRTIVEVELFITDLIERETDRTDFCYPLGLINYFAKEDCVLASDYFRRFVDGYSSDPGLIAQVRNARIYINELQSKTSCHK